MAFLRRISVFFSVACLLLSSCSLSPSQPEPTKADPAVVLTAAAQTALAQLNQKPTATELPQPSATLPPTSTVQATFPPSPIATTAVTAVTPIPSAQATAGTNVTQSAPSGEKAELVSDLDVPDGTVFKPGQTFIKNWRIKNTGTTTWTTEYSLARISGDAIVGPSSVNIPQKVAPGETVDIAVSMTAPSATGTHTSYWKLKNAQGLYFGGSASLDTAIWVQIIVAGSGTPVPTSATGTPGTPNAGVVSQVSLNVDNASYSGSCPHTFTLTANITLSKNSDVTYKLEAGSDTPGYTFQLPGPQTSSLSTGSQSLQFTLNMTDTGSGWVKLHIVSPDDVSSNTLNFELTCK